MLKILVKELCKAYIREEGAQKKYYIINQIFQYHYSEIIMIWGNNELKDYISNLFINPVIMQNIIKEVYNFLDYMCNLKIQEEIEYIEQFL